MVTCEYTAEALTLKLQRAYPLEIVDVSVALWE